MTNFVGSNSRPRSIDPAADIRDAIANASNMPELINKIWFHRTASAVIDAGRCVGCGGCIAACPSRSISVGDDGHPTLTRMCTGCSACWDYCPLGGLRVERLTGQTSVPTQVDKISIGTVRAAFSATALERATKAQDGGVVTALLATLIDAGELDGVILSRRIDAFHSEAFLATTAEAVLSAAGSVYHQSHPLAILNEALPPEVTRIAFVGTPCQISVLRMLQRFPWRNRKSAASTVVLTVALLCTRSFDPDALENAVAESGVETSEIGKIDIRDGQLRVHSGSGEELLRRSVREFQEATLNGCAECADFTGISADLTVGNLGSESGRSTVLIRTGAGQRAWENASVAFQKEPLSDLDPLIRTARRERRLAEGSVARGFDPEGSLWVSYGEHLEAYLGTERAPTMPPAYRSQHYDVTC